MHPLLESIQIQNLETATEMKDAIEQRGLLVKYDSEYNKLVVKYFVSIHNNSVRGCAKVQERRHGCA
jgi:hypothetical protein